MQEQEILETLPVETELPIEEKGLTEEERHALYLEQLKQAKTAFKTKKVYGVSYRKERKRKNSAQKKSKKNNRKK